MLNSVVPRATPGHEYARVLCPDCAKSYSWPYICPVLCPESYSRSMLSSVVPRATPYQQNLQLLPVGFTES